MKKLLLFSLLTGTSFLLINPAAAQLNFTTGQSPLQLATTLTGPGLLTTNETGQYQPGSAGTFTNAGVTGFGLTGGIILSTGNVNANLNNPATLFVSDDVNGGGDPLLDQIVAPGLTQDAAILEFDFAATNDSVEFYFVFASEEYNDYVNTTFNDAFAFFITGNGYAPNTNVAMLPGTTTPITINNVNNGGPYGATASGPCMNCTYYIDNVGTNNVGLCYDGFTTAIQIKFPVWPCSNYHFKISVADVSDGIFDSAVMLEANSFVPCPVMQANRNGVPVDNVTICAGGSATLTAPPGAEYMWSTGETTQSILVTQPGTYSFMISDPQQSSCYAFSSSVTVIQAGTSQTPVIVQTNNLLEAPNVVTTPTMTWQWFLNGNPIGGATQSTYTIPANGCYTVAIYDGTCESLSNEICVTNTSLYELQANSINVYPHPVINTSVIETPFSDGSVTTLKLKDISGREVLSVTEKQGNILQLEKGSLRSGIYFLEISNSEYQGTIVRKIVVQ